VSSKKKKVAIVFGITDNYTDMLANTLIGLKKHNKKFWDDIIVYHEDITERHQKQINKILPCVFQKKSSEDFAEFVPESQLKEYSAAAFFRFECFKLLDEYEKVIWHDVDVLFQDDQSDLLHYMGTANIALVKAKEFRVEHNFFELIPEYDMFVPMYNSGLMVLSDQLENYSEMCSWCYRQIKKYSKKLRWCDQGILNLLIQEYHLKVNEIDIHRFQCHPLEENYIKNAAIIHAYGSRKFWNDEEYKKMFPEWLENYNEWKKIQFSDKQENPLVSVLMSTYNRYDFLRESVESILNQTYFNLELIVVLEFCENQEKIEQILNSYHDKRIKIIKNKEKLGFSRSLNVGFDLSKGKYVARMDDDDISLPERLEKQVEFMEENPEIGACGTRAEFFMYASGGFEYIPTDPEDVKVKMLSFSTICHPSIMMRKESFDQYNLRYDPNYFTEDYELWSRAIKYLKIANLDDILLMYRASKQNATAGSNEEKIHSSHKKIVQNQCREYLGIELTDNELELLQGRKEIVHNSVDMKGALEIRKNLYRKIISANQKTHFYDEKVLNKFLQIEELPFIENRKYTGVSHSIKKGIKKILKPIYRPIYNGFERRIYGIMNNQRYMINQYNTELAEQIISEVGESNCRSTSLNRAVFLNDTFDDYHCGSSATSFVIRRYLSEKFTDVESIPINEIRFLQGETLRKCQFFDEDYMNLFISNNRRITDKIEQVDWVIVNGEGCISVYNKDTCNMLYLIHLAKYKFHKQVAIINTSIYRNNYVQDLTKEEQEEYDGILTTVINEVDYCVVRDYLSLIGLSSLKLKPVGLSFDCLPLYVKNYYNHFDLHLEKDYIVISGGNYLPRDYENIIYEIYQKTKKKMYFLYCNVKVAECRDELQMFERLSKKIGKDIELFKTADIDEFISMIDNASLLISGRFHHTIASFMVNTPFITFKTNTKKVESILSMMDYKDRLVDSSNAITNALELLKKNKKDDNREKQEEILALAENNFNFKNKE